MYTGGIYIHYMYITYEKVAELSNFTLSNPALISQS